MNNSVENRKDNKQCLKIEGLHLQIEIAIVE